jgi:hypothetical protein
MKADEPRDDTREPNAHPAPRSEDGAEQASEATILDGARHSWIVDCTDGWLKQGKGGFGIVGGVSIPPAKK